MTNIKSAHNNVNDVNNTINNNINSNINNNVNTFRHRWCVRRVPSGCPARTCAAGIGGVHQGPVSTAAQ